MSFNSGVFVSMSTILEKSDQYLPSLAVLDYLPLYMAGCLWTIVYDTVYGHQDKLDDKKIGVKSLALHWGDSTIKKSKYFTNLMFGFLALHGFYFDFCPEFYPSLFMVYFYFYRKLHRVDINDPESCKNFFQKMKVVGILLMFVFAIGNHSTLKEHFKLEEAKIKKNVNL
jgi:4-hydroxybenzoate polyprenyltransferase